MKATYLAYLEKGKMRHWRIYRVLTFEVEIDIVGQFYLQMSRKLLGIRYLIRITRIKLSMPMGEWCRLILLSHLSGRFQDSSVAVFWLRIHSHSGICSHKMNTIWKQMHFNMYGHHTKIWYKNTYTYIILQKEKRKESCIEMYAVLIIWFLSDMFYRGL